MVSPHSLPPAAVLYLARKAEGLAAFEAFVHSYLAHPAGLEHDLVVIYKGFAGGADLAAARAVFATCPHRAIEVDDGGFDLGSFLNAAGQIHHEYICCLNTFSRLLAGNWLGAMHAQAVLPEVGIVGATGSFEGLRDTITLVQKGIWTAQQLGANEPLPSLRGLREQLLRYFAYHLGSPAAFTTGRDVRPAPAPAVSDPRVDKRLQELDSAYRSWWAGVLRDENGSVAEMHRFPYFPNPHIRTNAFMIRRERFLDCGDAPLTGKMDACRFESGGDNLTRRIMRQGLKPRLVGRDGRAFDVADWPKSRTFRLGKQDNLLVADNQTALFDSFSAETRVLFTLMSWGEENVPVPADFPSLHVKFSTGKNPMETPPSPAAPRSAVREALLGHTLAFCNECLNRDDLNGAWQALCRARALAPDSTDVLNHRGRLALILNDPATARGDFTEALKIDPACSAALAGLARYHLAQGEASEAEAAATRALALNAGEEEARGVLAELQAVRLNAVRPAATAPDLPTVLRERDAARAERDAMRAERDAARQTIYGPFSTDTSGELLRFDSALAPVADRAANLIWHPAELSFPPYFFRPLNVRIDPELGAAPRLNLLLPSTSAAHNSGGPNTAYLLAAELARAGVPLRIIAVNNPADADSSAIRAHIVRLSGVPAEVVGRIEFVDGHNRAAAVVLGENDVFLATAWWTAQMLKYLLPRFRHPRFIYLIQDYEPNLHPISTNSMLALETYDLNYFPVVNSRLLYDHFVAERVGRFADAEFAREGCWFEPAVDRTLYYPVAPEEGVRAKRRLLFYARPDAPRNLLELGVAALMRLLQQGVLSAQEWEFFSTQTGIGGSCRPVSLSVRGDAILTPLPLQQLSNWAAEMRRTDIVLSLIWSPHTSYPVLEGAASGAMVVTNTCSVKTASRLQEISRNILAGRPTIEGVADAIAAAAVQSRNAAARVAGAQMGLPGTWRESFGQTVPRLLEFLQASGVSAAAPAAETAR